MSRYQRHVYRFEDLRGCDAEATNRLIFYWWCDDADRARFLGDLRRLKHPFEFPSRAAWQDDPAPTYGTPAPQGFAGAYLVTEPHQVATILANPRAYSNRPYTLLGGGSFLLGQDPTPTGNGTDWHLAQKTFIDDLFHGYAPSHLQRLAGCAVDQAALVSLAQGSFDLAQFAEQAALRYLGVLYGYAFVDHPLLEAASSATYRGLQYAALGRHFVTEPLTLPTAQQTLGAFVDRTAALMDEYYRLGPDRSPRAYGLPFKRSWPDGVQPYCELGLEAALGDPLLRRALHVPTPLSGRDRAIVLATMLAGTAGNIRTAVCNIVAPLAGAPAPAPGSIAAVCTQGIAARPPLPVVPRRKLPGYPPDGIGIPDGADVLVVLPSCPPAAPEGWGCPYPWGQTPGQNAVHACLARELTMPLIEAIVGHVAALPRLSRALDPVDLSPREIDRLWGFGALSLPLTYDAVRTLMQFNLIASFRVAPPISENAVKLRGLIAAGAPRVRDLLREFGGVHFAWFEFTENDTCLVLRTIYDGQFDAYIRYFAQRAGDLFDGLFEFLEDAPPRPVSAFPDEFVEAIRQHNGAPVANYLFRAHPAVSAARIRSAP